MVSTLRGSRADREVRLPRGGNAVKRSADVALRAKARCPNLAPRLARAPRAGCSGRRRGMCGRGGGRYKVSRCPSTLWWPPPRPQNAGTSVFPARGARAGRGAKFGQRAFARKSKASRGQYPTGRVFTGVNVFVTPKFFDKYAIT